MDALQTDWQREETAWKSPHRQWAGRSHLSKQGNGRFRALQYMSVVVAKRFNSGIKACCERLSVRGESPMQTLGAAMRRLVHICFGTLKH